jgi:hypothetical protein
MLRWILIGIAAVIAAFVVVVALQPSEFHLARTATVEAPADAVFAQVNDLKKWEKWSPWAKIDPNVKMTYEGPSEGAGTMASWSGNSEVGEGKMTLVESRPGELVKVNVDMVKPMEGSSRSEFTFKPDGDKTAVTWHMSAHHNFLQKAMCLVMNGKKMMREMMDEGLSKMNTAAKSS